MEITSYFENHRNYDFHTEKENTKTKSISIRGWSKSKTRIHLSLVHGGLIVFPLLLYCFLTYSLKSENRCIIKIRWFHHEINWSRVSALHGTMMPMYSSGFKISYSILVYVASSILSDIKYLNFSLLQLCFLQLKMK